MSLRSGTAGPSRTVVQFAGLNALFVVIPPQNGVGMCRNRRSGSV